MNYSQNANQKNTNNKKKKRNKSKNTVFTLILRVLIILVIVGGFAAGGAFLGMYMGIIETAPVLNSTDVVPEKYTSILYDNEGNEIDRLHKDENRVYVELSSIPLDLQEAVIAIEDERFYEHNGIDIKGMFRALFVNIKNMDATQGASTLTQQLIKNEGLSKEKTLKRKIQEQYLAVNLERDLEKSLGSKQKAKDYILELYLNSIALNHGLNGVQAASEFYYGKDVSQLTLAECASIAGITKNPSANSPISNPTKNKERQTLVLNKMKTLGYITEEQYTTAMAEDIYSKLIGSIKTNEDATALHSYFVDSTIVALAEQLMEVKGGLTKQQAYNMIYSGGLQIYLTVDPSMQKTMEESFANDALFPPSATSYNVNYTISVMDKATEKQSHYEREQIVSSEDQVDAFVKSVKDELLNDNTSFVADNVIVSKSLQAAMTIIDYRTGAVKAIVGGREKTGDLVFNRATQALRQPGSCFKILAAYAPAIDLGLVMPGTLIRDEEFTYNGWTPKNWYSSGYRGLSTVREGVRDSMNILAAKTIINVGIDTAYDYLVNFGFTTLEPGREVNGQLFSDKGPALSLGGLTDGVSVLELTAAYGAIANGGLYTKPVFYSKVLDHNGNVIIDNTVPSTRRVIKETTAYMLTDMMEDVVTSGTGRLAKFSKVSMSLAGKTGTTSDDKDLTFAGYTPYYVAGIWMGYDAPKKISYDRSYHLLLWKDVMEKVHTGLENKKFVMPKGISSKGVCSISGAAPNSLCSSDYFGSSVTSDISASDFASSSSTCTVHQRVSICKDSLSLPGLNCTSDTLISAVLAINSEGGIMNNPAEGGIDLTKTCTLEHIVIPVVDPLDPVVDPPTPADPLDPLNPSVPGTTPDTGTPDTSTPDTSTPDTGTPDTGTPDTGTPDTSTPDTTPPSEGGSTELPGLTGLPGLDE